VGLGVDELSMNPADIPAVKQTIRAVDFNEAQRLVEKALACESAAQGTRAGQLGQGSDHPPKRFQGFSESGKTNRQR